MAFIMGGGVSRASQANKPEKQLRIQSSIEGKAIPIGWGQARISGNLIWYGDFESRGGGSGGKGGGGKGGGGGGGGKGGGKGGSQQVQYRAAVAIALAQGPVQEFVAIWNNQSLTTFDKLDLTTFLGAEDQVAWSYLTSNHPSEAEAYRGIAYMASGPMALGPSPALPNLTVELKFSINGAIAGLPDANPRDVMTDYLTNAKSGAGFPSTAWDTNTLYANYCKATGMVVSPVLAEAMEAASFLGDLLERTNSEAVWSGGLLKVIPYGDTATTANGATYTPPSATGYSLTVDDFKPIQGGGGGGLDPIKGTRKPPADRKNMIPVEFLDRGNSYNPKVVDARDDAHIAAEGLRRADPRQAHFFCIESAALMSAHLLLAREAVRNEYTFTVGQEYILLEPMDVIAVTHARLDLSATPLRIKEITENSDFTLTIQAEDFLQGSSWAPPYNTETSGGHNPNINVSAGPVNAPVMFEPSYDLTNGQPEIWIAVSGAGTTSEQTESRSRRYSSEPTRVDYGGCEVWVSTDDQTYGQAGLMDGASRMGVLLTALPGVTRATTGPTIDATNVLQVDLAQVPGAQLLPGSQGDALAANTLSYVDGEYLAYENADLVSGQQYDISYLNRGLFGSSPASAHAAGSAFVRLEPDGVFRFAYTPDRIGSTLYFKFLSFNSWGGGRQELTDAVAYPYVIGGTPLTSAVDDVTNLSVVYVGAYANLVWDEVSDFRPVRYEIRQGASWDAAQILGSVAHPPFRIPGNGTFWVGAYSSPSPSVTVYSTDPASVVVSGAVIVANVIATFDEAALGWPGTLGGTAGISGANITTTGAGDIFALSDLFSPEDLFNVGGQGNGSYEIPADHIVDIGRVATCNVNISWAGQGLVVGQDILTISDFLAQTDILGFAATANTSIYPEVAVSQDGVTFGDWQKFQAGGALTGMAFKARMQLITNDAQTQALLTAFSFSVDVPDRNDHYNRVAVLAGGTSITFKPDSSVSTAAFNGGPGDDTVPHVQGTIIDAQAGDLLVISSLTATGCTVQVMNGGVGVARTVNILAQGY